MKGQEQLPREIVWSADGHLSEVAMTAIADGEEAILPRDAFAHLGVCEGCAAGVEGAASLSAAMSRVLAVPAPAEVLQAAPRRLAFPVWAAALAMTVAGVATLPNVGVIRVWMGRLWWVLREGMPMFTRHAASVLPHAWNWLPLMSLTAAMLLLLVGLSVARLAPRALER